MKQTQSLSIFFPCYNDKGTIATMVLEAKQVAEKLTDDFEIIVIDDGSSDGSRELLLRLQQDVSQLKLVFHETNQGYGGALRSGFGAATKDLVFYTDGDAQYDVKELPKLFAKLTDNVDIVNGYKIKRSDPWHRVIIGTLYQYAMKLVFWLPIKDPDCDFRLIRKQVFSKIKLKSNTGTITIELVKKIQQAGFKFAEVGVHHYFRVYGQSQFFNFKRVAKTLIKLVFLWFELVIFSSPALAIILRRIVELNFRTQKRVIRKYLQAASGEQVLDLGCGSGEFSPLFSKEQYVGIDIDERSIRYAKHHYPGKKFVVADGIALPFGEHTFDKILVVGVLHHLSMDDSVRVLDEIKRVLKVDGQVLIMEDTRSRRLLTRAMHALDQGSYIRSFSDWQELLQKEFTVQEAFTFKNGICFYSAFLIKPVR